MKDSIKELYIFHSSALLQLIIRRLHSINITREVASYFRKNKQLGSRDRKIIRNIIYGYFRWKNIIDLLAVEIKIPIILSLEKLADTDWKQFFLNKELLNGDQILSFSKAESTKEKIEVINLYYKLKLSPWSLLPSFMRNLIRTYSDEDFFNCLQKRNELSLWVNKNFVRSNFPSIKKHQISKYTYILPHNTKIKESLAYLNGEVEIQNIATQMIVHACQVTRGATCWDACCGAGGKSLHLAYIVGKNGHIDASDVRKRSLIELKRRTRRLNIMNISSFIFDLKNNINTKSYDMVLVDAPCSGSGTWKSHPYLKWQTKPEDINKNSILQGIFLENASKSVKISGKLVYATCSIFEAENEQVIQKFIMKNPNFILQEQVHPLTRQKSCTMIRSNIETGHEDGTFVVQMKRIW